MFLAKLNTKEHPQEVLIPGKVFLNKTTKKLDSFLRMVEMKKLIDKVVFLI